MQAQLKQLENQSDSQQAQILALQRQAASLQESNTALQTHNANLQVPPQHTLRSVVHFILHSLCTHIGILLIESSRVSVKPLHQ